MKVLFKECIRLTFSNLNRIKLDVFSMIRCYTKSEKYILLGYVIMIY